MNIILDYDGTLHDSLKIYKPAFLKCCELISKDGFVTKHDYSESEIKRCIGIPPKTMWNEFMPNIPESYKEKYSNFIGKEMLRYINRGYAVLYEGAKELLEQLKNDGHRLIFLSNCKRSYMETHIRWFELGKFFDEFYCSQDYNFIPKYIMFDKIKSFYEGDFIIVGDRKSDIEIAEHHRILSIGCAYGYGEPGELENADYLAYSVKDILKYI